MKNARCNPYSETQQVVAEFLVPVPGFSLEECFAPEIIAMTFSAPEEVEIGWFREIVDGSYVAPPPSPPSPVLITQAMVRACLTLPDQVKWDNNQTPEIVTVKTNFQNGLTNPTATENMQFLYDTQSISLASLDEFKATYPLGD
jgi:hypothetical protein